MNENQMMPQASVSDRKPRVVRDVFFNLATMSALYTALTSLIFLMSAILERALPDEFTCGNCVRSEYSIAYYLSLVIVSYVLYAYFSWKMRHDEGVQAMHTTSLFHRIVIYFTLFLMGLAIAYEAVDLITVTVYYGITAVSFVKFLAIALIAGSVFGYEFIDLKRSGDTAHSKVALTLWWILAAVVAGAIVGSFLVLGSPASQKEKRFDESRSDDLSSLQSDIETYAYHNYALPKNLSVLDYVYYDPQTGDSYKYAVTGKATYSLCADFSQASTETGSEKTFRQVYGHNMPKPAESTMPDTYTHGRGHTCFDFTNSDLVDSYETYPEPAYATSTVPTASQGSARPIK
jgi:hypothetical protein